MATRRTRAGAAVALAVSPALHAIAARRHRAPSRGAVARRVVERPLACVVRAYLQPVPVTSRHGAGDAHEQLTDRPVNADAFSHEPISVDWVEADSQAHAPG